MAIICQHCKIDIADSEAEFSQMMSEGKAVRVRTGPPGFADFDEYHADCVGGPIAEHGQNGQFVWHIHANGHRCTGDADLNGINCTSR